MRNLITLFDLEPAEIERIFTITEDLKAKFHRGVRDPLLPGRVMALIFEKPSLRTRVSFEAAMSHLGGTSMFLGDDVGFGQRESVEDFARVLSEYVDVIVVRAKEHSCRPSLPGLGRSVHAPRNSRFADRAQASLRGRWQQRGPLAGDCLWKNWHADVARFAIRV